MGGLSAFKKPVAFEIAVPHVGEEISFYIAVPKLMAEVADKTDPGSLERRERGTLAGRFQYLQCAWRDLGGIREIERIVRASDPDLLWNLASILSSRSSGTLAKINEIGEGVALQMVLRPAGRDTAKGIRKYLELLKKGEPAKQVFGDGFPCTFKDVGEVFNPKTEEEKSKGEKRTRGGRGNGESASGEDREAAFRNECPHRGIRRIAVSGAGYFGRRGGRLRAVRQPDAQRVQDREAAQPETHH